MHQITKMREKGPEKRRVCDEHRIQDKQIKEKSEEKEVL
jgi:hypothetical protein